MLRYLRINDPYRLLGLLILLALLCMPFFIHWPGITYPELKSILIGDKVSDGAVPFVSLIDSTGPITSWFLGLVSLLFGQSLWIRHVLAFLILFSQSTFLGMAFINKKAFSESTYIPSFLFSIIAFFSFDVLALSGELLGTGFLLLALNNLFKEIEFRAQRDETIFNLGVCISLASLCNFSFVFHLLGASAILIIFTRTSARRFALMIFGFLIPHLLVMGIYFLNENFQALWEFYYLPGLSFGSVQMINYSGLFILAAFPLLFLLISLFMLNREARFTKYQSQLLQCMFFWLIFSVLQGLFSKDLRPQSFLAVLPCLSFFITHFLLSIRRRRFAEISIWILSVGTLSVSYMACFNKIGAVDYSSLLVKEGTTPGIKDKKVLVLGDEFEIYRTNKLSTPFLNWSLSKDIFENPDCYENVIAVRNGLMNDLPDLIIDENGLLKRFLERIPSLRKMYKHPKPFLYELNKPQK